MCGIVGFVGEGDARVLAAMRAAVAHRGPDDDATWTGQAGGRAVAFGFRRLAIIDLQGGAQPMVAADGRIVVMNNGEIYNFRELRRELEGLGHRFVSDHADTEVLVHGYRQWGEGIVDRLDGMFAFAILDRAAGRLFLGRDRFGKKPLYLAEVAGGLVFGSELRAVARHPAVARRIDRDALAQYFAFGYVPAPRTLFQGIGKLRAGETVVYDLATLASQRRRYWTYRVRSRDPLAGGPEDWAVELRRLLDRAVERRLVSDVPLGFFLSGGIDSSAVVGLARRHLGAAALKTFTIGFEAKDYDESPLADLVARRFQTDHTVDVLDLDKAAGLAREVLGRIDEPFVDDAVIPNFLLARLARRHVTVVLSGDGGDEMFAGYDTFPVLSLAKAYYRTVPTAVHGLIRRAVEALPVTAGRMALDFKLRRALRGLGFPPELWHPIWLGPSSLDEVGMLLKARLDPEAVYGDAARLWRSSEGGGTVDRALEFFAGFYLAEDILPKVDRSSMLNSLEVRSPFLDRDLAEFCLRLPAEVKLKRGETKWLLKRALADLLPAEILHRRKQGFSVPVLAWLDAMAKPDLDFAEGLGVDAAFLARRWDEHRERKGDHRGLLWAWHCLEASLKGID